MSKFEHKPGQFTLFKNDKTENERAPQYKGDGLSLDGKPILVSAWLKEGRNGKFMSCRIQEKTFNKEAKPDQKEKRTIIDELNDDIDSIPF